MKHWYVVRTKPRQESIAQENLQRQGFDCFLPLIKEWRKRRGSKVLSEVPLFPNYIFTHLDLNLTNCAPIRSTRGVNTLVRFGDECVPVPDPVIESIDSYSRQQLAHPDINPYHPGQQIKIESGPFAGLNAIFLKQNGEERALLLLEMLGQQQHIEMPLAVLE